MTDYADLLAWLDWAAHNRISGVPSWEAGNVRDAAAAIRALVAERGALDTELAEICDALPGIAFMDPPDGGAPSIAEQVRRMYAALQAQDAAVANLTSERDALRADAERMQFCEDTVRLVYTVGDDVFVQTPAGTFGSATVRDAIDAARGKG